MTIDMISGIAEIAERYDGFIVDIWGVLHDGATAYPGAIACLENLRAAGKAVVLLSNAPRPAAEVLPTLRGLGYDRSLFGGVMTSGEEVWQNLKRRDDPWYAALGERVYLLGPMKDSGMVKDIQGIAVERLEDADVVLNTGADFGETVADFEDALQTAISRNLPMICANPDLVVIHHGDRHICAGAIAARYEELGGTVRYHGKPHPSVYQSCYTLLGIDDCSRIAAIGDGLGTDMTGAKRAGIDGYFVLGGIHAEELGVGSPNPPTAERVESLCRSAGVTPAGAMTAFVW